MNNDAAEIDHLLDLIKDLTAQINALNDELAPYFGLKRTLEQEAHGISFVTGAKRKVPSVKWCGLSPAACKERLERYGKILDPGHTTSVRSLPATKTASTTALSSSANCSPSPRSGVTASTNSAT